MEKPGGLPLYQMPAPTLLERPPSEQISAMGYSLGQIRIAPWTDWSPKKNTNNKEADEKKKRHVAKRVGHPELWREGEGHSLTGTVNKQACQRRQEWHTHPATLKRGKLATVAVMRKAPPERGEEHSPTWTVNKQAGQRRQVWCHLPQCAWRVEGLQQSLKCGMLHKRVGEGHLPMWTLKKKGLQFQQAGRGVYWRKQKGHESRRTLNKQSLWG
jgi:hypothetical protein